MFTNIGEFSQKTIAEVFGKEEKDVKLATLYNLKSDYTKFINLFKF